MGELINNLNVFNKRITSGQPSEGKLKATASSLLAFVQL